MSQSYDSKRREVQKANTRLEWAIKNRDNYVRDNYVRRSSYQFRFTLCSVPLGTSGDEWLKWRAWVDARRDDFAKAIKKARDEKRHNQRSKADERKCQRD